MCDILMTYFLPPAYLEHFVADFNPPVLLFCWILTDIFDVPAMID